MIYSLLVLSSPFSGQCSRTAAEFAQHVLARGHSIHRIFFLDTGTLTSAANSVFPQGEDTPLTHWTDLSDQHDLDLVVCISSALKYGMLDQTEADRYERPHATIHSAFTVSGLGQLVDACATSDRLITFGG